MVAVGDDYISETEARALLDLNRQVKEDPAKAAAVAAALGGHVPAQEAPPPAPSDALPGGSTRTTPRPSTSTAPTSSSGQSLERLKQADQRREAEFRTQQEQARRGPRWSTLGGMPWPPSVRPTRTSTRPTSRPWRTAQRGSGCWQIPRQWEAHSAVDSRSHWTPRCGRHRNTASGRCLVLRSRPSRNSQHLGNRRHLRCPRRPVHHQGRNRQKRHRPPERK